ncbi:MAG: PCRF domain-containing protein [Patescibacteria group bacterium]
MIDTDMYNPYQSQIDRLQQQLEETKIMLADPQLKELAQTEMVKLETELKSLSTLADEFTSSQSDETDVASDATQSKSCTLEFRGGAGGDEAKLWSEDLKRMYLRFAEQQNLKVMVLDDSIIKLAGQIRVKLATPTLHFQVGQTKTDSTHQETRVEDRPGQTTSQALTAYQLLKFESGVHRVQRVPTTEAQGRIHTSTATVAVLPEVHQSAVLIKPDDLEWQFIRSSGAGGQSVNKTSSAVRLTHIPSQLVVTARAERSQVQNREIALNLLRAQLWQIEEDERLAKLGDARSAIGRAQRSEKIRTYNFPQNRITDHRTKQSWHNLSTVLEGSLLPLLTDVYTTLTQK